MSSTEDDTVTLVIPQFLQNSLDCFKANCSNDITRFYKIVLMTPDNRRLYVDNERDLRNTLKHYCLYKMLSEKMDEEMNKLNLEFHVTEDSVKLTRAPANYSSNECGKHRFNYATIKHYGCDVKCGSSKMRSCQSVSSLTVPKPKPAKREVVLATPEPQAAICDKTEEEEKKKKKCCTIL